MELNVLLRLLMAHLLSDFVFQPDAWVKSKQSKKIRSAALYLHAGVVTVITYLLFWDWGKWYVPLIISLSHLVIDILKCYTRNTFVNFLTDQLLHITLTIVVWLIFYFNIGEITHKTLSVLGTNNTWLLLLGYFTMIWPLGIAIGKATEKWQTAAGMNAGGLDKAGMWIGRCERVLVFTFIIMGQYTALGFLMTAKSILRFTDKDKMTQKKTEYVLVGTLISFTSAAVIGAIVAYAIK